MDVRNRLLEYFDTNTKTFHSEIEDMDELKNRIALLEQCRKDDADMENKIKPIEDKYAKLAEFEAHETYLLQCFQCFIQCFTAAARCSPRMKSSNRRPKCGHAWRPSGRPWWKQRSGSATSLFR